MIKYRKSKNISILSHDFPFDPLVFVMVGVSVNGIFNPPAGKQCRDHLTIRYQAVNSDALIEA